MLVIRRYLFALKGKKWDTGSTLLNGLQNHDPEKF
jgi:hypothetical protein